MRLALSRVMNAAPHWAEDLDAHRQPDATLIIVAEGDVSRREAVSDMLLREGYDVMSFDSGAELLQYLYNSISHQLGPALVICDAELAGIDGAQVCKISRAQNTLVPFIVLARPGTPGAFDSMELVDDACVLNADVDLAELKASVVRLAGDP